MAAQAKLPNPHAAAEWLAVMRATDALQLAGLRRRIVPSGDLQAAYRQSYEAHMQEHDQALIAMLQRPDSDRKDQDDGR